MIEAILNGFLCMHSHTSNVFRLMYLPVINVVTLTISSGQTLVCVAQLGSRGPGMQESSLPPCVCVCVHVLLFHTSPAACSIPHTHTQNQMIVLSHV